MQPLSPPEYSNELRPLHIFRVPNLPCIKWLFLQMLFPADLLANNLPLTCVYKVPRFLVQTRHFTYQLLCSLLDSAISVTFPIQFNHTHYQVYIVLKEPRLSVLSRNISLIIPTTCYSLPLRGCPAYPDSTFCGVYVSSGEG